MEKYARIKYQPCLPLGEDGRRATGSAKHIALSRRAAGEGMVLLKNEGGTLPLQRGTKVALFGQASVNYVKGGGGSGEVYSDYTRNVYDGFAEKEKEGKVSVFQPLRAFYQKHVDAELIRQKADYESDRLKAIWAMEDKGEQELARGDFMREVQVQEAVVPEALLAEARAFADTAIITFGRFSSEGYDRAGVKGDFYLSDKEMALAEQVKAAFPHCIVVLDVGGMVDSEWFIHDDTVGAVLLAWQAGMEGGSAIADILCGDVNPSGKLVDTFAKAFADYPYAEHFNDSTVYVDYTEDIYVGYRYFETVPTARDRVNYPFGFGLSYTTFRLWGIAAYEAEGTVTVTANVTNTGDVAGKEVVQVYYSAPQGLLGKPARELCAFAKTKLLQPGESQALAMTFRVADMASFDDLGKIAKSAYVLEKGDYAFHVGTSVRDTVQTDFVYTVAEDTVTEQLTSLCAPVALKERMLADGSLEALTMGEAKHFFAENAPITAKAPAEEIPFSRVGEACTLDEFIAQFTDEELCEFMGASEDVGVSNTQCFSGLKRLGVPPMPTADGPAGLRLQDWICGVRTTSFPCAALLACTWNTDLLEEIGQAGGLEVKENNLAVWLTPAMNIHRTPLCGRNFEYFSEDPFLSGKMAAAKVRGIQSNNIACSVKHFACNGKEVNRTKSDSRVSERALREIYLKGFEICVKEADPWTIMTSYNIINGIQASENWELINGILRGEWGFKGMVTTDWGQKNNPVYEVKAGNDMKMHIGYPEDLMAALKTGELKRADLEACARRILSVYMRLD
ncbi:MAG: glycoside hydrolase family 3 protein [Clostridia bacterium]|nr:glycoside hydrolase family 3 protein [Clostridia bacterium]